jgi:hypothetical protein
MLQKILQPIVLCFAILALNEVLGQPTTSDPPDPIKQALQGDFPRDQFPIEYEGNTFPPKLKSQKVTTPTFKVTPEEFQVSDRLIAELRRVAIHNPNVAPLLGRRYALTVAGTKDSEKGDTSLALVVRLIFYSYERRSAVAVDLLAREGKVLSVVPLDRSYQPPEGPEEVALADAILKRSGNVKTMVNGLKVSGILTPSEEGTRRLRIQYQARNSDQIVLSAIIDLTNEKVLQVDR